MLPVLPFDPQKSTDILVDVEEKFKSKREYNPEAHVSVMAGDSKRPFLIMEISDTQSREQLIEKGKVWVDGGKGDTSIVMLLKVHKDAGYQTTLTIWHVRRIPESTEKRPNGFNTIHDVLLEETEIYPTNRLHPDHNLDQCDTLDITKEMVLPGIHEDENEQLPSLNLLAVFEELPDIYSRDQKRGAASKTRSPSSSPNTHTGFTDTEAEIDSAPTSTNASTASEYDDEAWSGYKF